MPLSGGTVTGRVYLNTSSIFGHNTDALKLLEIIGGDTGAILRLYSNNDLNIPGTFSISTGNDKRFEGFATGNLLWAGKEVERVNSIGENYIRYESGLQICWGLVYIPANSKSIEVLLPLPCKDADHLPIGIYIAVSNGQGVSVCTNTMGAANKFTIMCASYDNIYDWDKGCYWLDVGRWK